MEDFLRAVRFGLIIFIMIALSHHFFGMSSFTQIWGELKAGLYIGLGVFYGLRVRATSGWQPALFDLAVSIFSGAVVFVASIMVTWIFGSYNLSLTSVPLAADAARTTTIALGYWLGLSVRT